MPLYKHKQAKDKKLLQQTKTKINAEYTRELQNSDLAKNVKNSKKLTTVFETIYLSYILFWDIL